MNKQMPTIYITHSNKFNLHFRDVWGTVKLWRCSIPLLNFPQTELNLVVQAMRNHCMTSLHFLAMLIK